MAGTSSQAPQPRTPRGSIRRDTTIEVVGQGWRFRVPAQWVRWLDENETRPNMHLTPVELDSVKDAEGEWDREFALVVNAMLPFDQCVAHVGSEGWGLRGISYADLQVRVYVLTATPEAIEERARVQGAAAITSLTGSLAVPQQELSGSWRRMILRYFLMYSDYGATSIVDLRLKQAGDRVIAFAFMYTDHSKPDAEIEAILDSVALAGGPQAAGVHGPPGVA